MKRLHRKLNTRTTSITQTWGKHCKCQRNEDFGLAPDDSDYLAAMIL